VTNCEMCFAQSELPGCWKCAATLGSHLEAIPDLLTELEVTLTRQGRRGDPVGGKPAERPLVFQEAASNAHTALCATVNGWYRYFADQLRLRRPATARVFHGRTVSPVALASPAAVAALSLSDGLAVLRRSTEFVEVFQDVRDALRAAQRAIDIPHVVYAGGCPECGKPMYMGVGNEMVTCAGCETRCLVADQLEMVEGARDAHLTATEMSRALPTWQGRTLTASMIRGYALRGSLVSTGVRQVGTARRIPVYRLGDLLDLLYASDMGDSTSVAV
jgi:hypothetical protein